MRLALSSLEGRIAPVFDVSRKVIVLDLEDRNICSRREEMLPPGESVLKIRRLSELGIEVLICGAVSQEVSRMVVASGIELIAFIAGDLDSVADGYLADKLSDHAFRMPGCSYRHRKRRKHGLGKQTE